MRPRRLVLLFVLALALAVPVTASATEPVELRVMTFNDWYGGDEVGCTTGSTSSTGPAT